MSEDQLTETRSQWTIERRREFMSLPIAERRRQLAEQAARMVDHYSRPQECDLREDWQRGDVVESES